jgi:HTH-type transcriptional regulator / antitoxin MqsA
MPETERVMREAAKIFGGGINAFSRYENGKTKPPLVLVKAA